MSKIIVEKINSSYAHVDADEDTLLDLHEFFKVYAEGYMFDPRYKMHGWDGKIPFFNPRSGALPIGLTPAVIKYANENKLTVEQIGFEIESEFDEDKYKATVKNALSVSKMEMRDYQDEACRKALQEKFGILQCCTSSGKSMIIYNFIRNILTYKKIKKVLLIVPSVSLVEQMFADFKQYGWQDIEEEVEMLYGGKEPSFDLPVLISTWQSLQSLDQDYFESIDAVIVDECHQSKARVINDILKMCINTEYRIGTTGTLPTAACDLMNITGVLGSVLYTISSKQLIDRGILTKMIIGNIKLIYPKEVIKANRDRPYPEEVRLVEEYPNRSKVLQFIFNHLPKEHNVLLLCNHVDHLNETADWIKDNYKDRNVMVISGSVSAKKREEIRTSIEKEDGVVLVATYGTCSTGINIPKLHDVILYANSKSKIKVLQSLGRGLRKHASKSKVILYDVIDDLSYKTRSGKLKKNYLYKHWEERDKYYKEQGFPRKTTELVI